MPQMRICAFIGRPCTHSRTFLDLPAAVRLSVYKEAGLPLDVNIFLIPTVHSESADKGEKNGSDDGDKDCEIVYNTILSLLQSCRAIHDEVLSIVLSRNTLYVEKAHAIYGLSFLCRLTPGHCSVITRLYIELQRDSSGDREKIKHPKISWLTAWNHAIRHVLANCTPGSLKLCLVCDRRSTLDNSSILVTRPFFEYPGRLARLDLRLAKGKDRRLSVLALETVAYATGNYSHPAIRKGIFRFFDLPKEIRKYVLAFTDLITPTQQVQWNSQFGYRWERLSSLQYHCCQIPFWDPREETIHECEFCSLLYSAYNPACHCWAPPDALMLVSRLFYHEAQAVFLENNHIAADSSLDYRFPYEYSPLRPVSRVDPSRFLTRYMWPEILCHIKYLQLNFREPDVLLCHDPCSPTSLDWSFAVSHLQAHANVANLTLAIYLSKADPRTARNYSTDMPLYQKYQASARSALERQERAYESIMTPLKALRHLKRLFFYVQDPGVGWCRCSERCRPIASDEHGYGNYSLTYNLELSLERQVMGSRYDARALGKYDFESPRWMIWHRDRNGFPAYC